MGDLHEDETPPDEPIHRTPRWVQVSAAVAGVVVLVLVVLHLTGNNLGGHT